MAEFTVTLTEAEEKAMAHVALSTQDWIQNAITVRANSAIEDIVNLVVKKCLDGGIAIPSTKDEMVDLAYANDWIKTAEERNAEILAQQTASSEEA
jgi:hypothetical protein